ncbi:MAG: hypothetical protein QOF54_9 [Solirubrobacteraceae bacterium]|nr:hypothetical protein [Solirubrobacteraceae bacterium]
MCAPACAEAASGNRTRIIALEGRGSTVELPPRARIRPSGRFGVDDSLHKRRRTWRSRRGRRASSGRECLSRARSACRGGGRTRARSGPAHRSRRTGAGGRSRRGAGPARRRRPACGAARWRCSGPCLRRSVLACTPRGTGGSSCRADHAIAAARRTRAVACAPGSDHIDGVRLRCVPARTHVRIQVGHRSVGFAVESTGHGEWRSLVAHPAGGRAVAGSNPVSPIRKPLQKGNFGCGRSTTDVLFVFYLPKLACRTAASGAPNDVERPACWSRRSRVQVPVAHPPASPANAGLCAVLARPAATSFHRVATKVATHELAPG